jgi:zinc transporter 9
MFHYGYGAERFLFALLSAVGIFVLGCGVTVYHGVHTWVDPPTLKVGWLTFAVLGISFVLDSIVFVTAIRAVAAEKGDKGFFAHIRTSSDPTVLAVLFEDFVATSGVVVAAIGIWLSHVTGDTRFDAAASIVIGLMLGAVAVWLGWRNRVLILGPAIPKDVEDGAVAFLKAQPSVQGVRSVKTKIIAADAYRMRADIDYDGRELGRRHADWLRAQIAAGSDPAAVAPEFGERFLAALSGEAQRIEGELRQKFPKLRHVDFEVDEREPEK